jgi:polyisoprenoid-binding protein YceI
MTRKKQMMMMMMFTALLLSAAAAQADITVDFDHSQGSLEFSAVGRPSALKIVGKSGAPKGSLLLTQNTIAGALLLDLNGLDTGIELRNHHMKEKYLQTQTYPQAELKLQSVGFPLEKMGSDYAATDVPFAGTLLLHGVEKPVSGKSSFKRVGDTLTGNAKFQIKLSDFVIGVPSFMGITVADVVDVTTTFQAPLVQMGKIISKPGNKSDGN